MSRDPAPGPGDENGPPSPPEPDEPTGHVTATSPGVLVGFALTGLVLGWLLRPASVRFTGVAPTVSWFPLVALVFLTAAVAGLAWSTYRLIHRDRRRLEPHLALNRLLMAKSCALVGALVAGGYLGYAVSWLGLTEAQLAGQRITRSLLAAATCGVLVTAALLLERACRVRKDDS